MATQLFFKKLLFIFSFLLITLIFVSFFTSFVFAFTCAVRTSCIGGEVCLFSLFSSTNSHAGDCSAYTNKVCCDFSTAVIRTTTCPSNETGVISLLRTTNSHVEQYGLGNYINNVCLNNSDANICSVKSTCAPDEACVVSINKSTNSHAARCGYFGNQICCSSPQPYTLTGNAYYYDTGLPITTGIVTAIIKETGEKGTATINNGAFTLKINSTKNFTTDSFTLSLIINSTDNRRGYAQLVVGAGRLATITQCSVKQIQFSGIAIDSVSGNSIQQGFVTVSAQGLPDVNSTSFTNGAWNIYYRSCFVLGQIYTFNILIYGNNNQTATTQINEIVI